MTQAEGSGVFRRTALEPGLHVVSTPIGAARDITLRALDVLASADVLVAEDTRTLRRLMEIHGIPRQDRALLAYHDHNGAKQRPRLMGLLAAGKSIAYCSDAGTPLVADPGYQLVRAAVAEGHVVRAVPGASAALAGLTVSGLPSDRFLFVGFPPAQAGARRSWLQEVTEVRATLVIYETGRRIGKLMEEIAELGHGAREAALCRELTKRFEEVRRGAVAEIVQAVGDAPPKGELVLLLGPPTPRPAAEEDLAAALKEVLGAVPLKQAAADIAERFNVRKRDVYQLGLRLEAERK